jgi:hypothetical protein
VLKNSNRVTTPRILRPEECTSATAIQAVIDETAVRGGIVQLPELNLTLDRGLQLRTGVELRGQGPKTILRKGPGRLYPLSGYHNYGMTDVPLISTEGLEVGMTVTIYDEEKRGFYTTFARITWIENNWVGLDRGISSDYGADDRPRLVTTYPLVFGSGIRGAALRDLTLDGNRAANPHAIDGCRNGAVYFDHCDSVEITNVNEYAFNGEGLSFQMCAHMEIRDCSFGQNSGNGLHPGAGSTNVRFENCRSEANDANGFFFCVRANHVTTRNCAFVGNKEAGVSIGTRDCFNLIEDCTFLENGGPGIVLRTTPRPTEVHSCTVRHCEFKGNAQSSGRAQIEIVADAHDIVIAGCRFDGNGMTDGVMTGDQVAGIFLEKNTFVHCRSDLIGNGFTLNRPAFTSGAEHCLPEHYRHLPIDMS